MLGPAGSLEPVDRRPRAAPVAELVTAPPRRSRVRLPRTRRGRAVLAGAAAALAIAGGSALVVAEHRASNRPETVIAGPDPTEVPDGPITVHGHGLRVRVDAPRDATVGTRIWLQVTLTNTTAEPIALAPTGPCQTPVTAAVVRVGGRSGADPPSGRGSGRGAELGVGPAVAWDGDARSLPRALGSQPAPGRFGDAASTDCVALAGAARGAILPGSPVTRRIPIDLRWGTDRPHGAYLITVDTGRIDAATSQGPIVHTSLPVQLHDNPVRASTAGQVSGSKGIGRAPTLAAWVASSRHLAASAEGGPQSWSVSLGWWSGSWEAWVWGRWPSTSVGHDAVRITWDPVRSRVVDVRAVPEGQRASDDPDFTPVPGARQEQIRYRADQ